MRHVKAFGIAMGLVAALFTVSTGLALLVHYEPVVAVVLVVGGMIATLTWLIEGTMK